MEQISYDDFSKLDLRVGKVISAEEIDGSEKLLKLQIDLDEEKPRQILAGIKKQYTPEDLMGKNVVVVANLEPRKLMGMESNGMVLAATDSKDSPVVLTTLTDVESGAKIS